MKYTSLLMYSFLFSCVAYSFILPAADNNGDYNEVTDAYQNMMPRMVRVMGGAADARLKKYKAAHEAWRVAESMKKSIAEAETALSEARSSNKSEEEVQRLEMAYDLLKETRDQMLISIPSLIKGKGSEVGLAFAMGIAEKNAALIQEIPTSSQWGGIKVGIMYTIGKFVGKKLEDSIHQGLGQAWDTIVGGFLHMCAARIVGLWNFVFHQGKRPFSVKELELWKKDILQGVLQDLAKNAGQSYQAQAKGREAHLRMMHSPDATQETVMEIDVLWKTVSRGYIQDIDRVIKGIEYRKKYYTGTRQELSFDAEESEVVAQATRLQDSLRILKEHIIESSDSLKEVVQGERSIFIAQLTKDINHRFTILKEVMASYHGLSFDKADAYGAGKPTKQPFKESPFANPYAMGGF